MNGVIFLIIAIALGMNHQKENIGKSVLCPKEQRTMTSTVTTTSLQTPPKSVEKFRSDYTPTSYKITHTILDFNLDEVNTLVDSTLTVHRDSNLPYDLILDGADLVLKTVKVNDKDITSECSVDGTTGPLTIPSTLLPFKQYEDFTLAISVRVNPRSNLQLSGLFMSGKIMLTQCEAEGFRRITYFLDRPDVMSTFRVKLTAAKDLYPGLLSNGNRIEYTSDDPKTHTATYDDPHPKPAYLFAVVAGDLAVKESTFTHPKRPNDKPVDIALYCEHSVKHKLDFAMEAVKKSMQWDEDRFGLKYDLERFSVVCVRDFNMGAMENKGLNIFVSALLVGDPGSATDADFQRILRVVGHEYFHNWTGNRVTCRDWFQLTLKEGLTVFREQEFARDMGSPAVVRIQDVKSLRELQFREDAGPLSHPIRPESYVAMDNFYTMTVYEKGAEVIRMMQTLVGREGFEKGLKLYFERHDGHAVTCDDFRAAIADANGKDLSQFERWYTHAGTPNVTVEESKYDAAKKLYTLTLSQKLPNQKIETRPLHMPIVVGLIGRVSKKEVAPSRILELIDEKQTFEFQDIQEDVVPSILRDFSAPVKLIFPQQTDEDVSFLIGFDTDPFNSWEAGQKIMMKILLARVNGTADPSMPQFYESFGNLLKKAMEDPAYTALSLAIPSPEAVVLECPKSDPQKIYDARESLKKDIRLKFESELMSLYQTVGEELRGRPYQISQRDTGLRSLRNTVLVYLTQGRTPETMKLAFAQFEGADNMTDRLTAIMILAGVKCEERTKALDMFYEMAKTDSEIMDRWFVIQALADTETVLDDIKRLKEHPEFSMTTPPRMRALCFAYVGNFVNYHRKDGKGYEFIADVVIELDKFNSQVAARGCAILTRFGQLEDERSHLMENELRRVLAAPHVSADVREIAERALK
eukprot:GHVO01032857.1.p1 GENE.GHVO01032857.1~~GHVO01032857.1.p1  ORF type:complete len:921 (+),score=193.10 GHVO01032857.1:327-3089(+)